MGGSLLSQGGLLLLPHKCTCQGMPGLWVGGGGAMGGDRTQAAGGPPRNWETHPPEGTGRATPAYPSLEEACEACHSCPTG